MRLQDCFGRYPLERFLEEHLHRLPFALPDAARGLQSIGTWNELASMLGGPDVDLMVVRNGQRHPESAPADPASAQRLIAEGCTLVIRHAERHNAQISELAKAFAETFRGPVNVHLYATPPECFGFGWHYDAEDVFIFQTAGEKEYWLRKNIVNPWPLEETMPADMRFERELMPLMRVLLRAGDLLYIPCGYWHRAQATASSETAISLAVGVMSPSAVDVFDLIRDEVVQSLVWRQRLPVLPGVEGGNGMEAFQYLLEQLALDLSRTLTSTQFAKRVSDHFSKMPVCSE
jgi:ribosomal protein L16 Arg81 hydroxylase